MSKTPPIIGIPVYTGQSKQPPHAPIYGLSTLYSAGVVAGGGAPLLVPLGLEQDALRAIFDRLDGVLLAGGGDIDPDYYGEAASEQVRGLDRDRDELEVALMRWAVASGKPLLAICRGHQVLNVALGGNLYQDVPTDLPDGMRHDFFTKDGFPRDYLAHDVVLVSDSDLTKLLGSDRLFVNSSHHQAIKDLAPGLTAIGHAPDGLLEAIQVDGHPFAFGVQWHPEGLFSSDPLMCRLFEAFVKAAQNGRSRTP